MSNILKINASGFQYGWGSSEHTASASTTFYAGNVYNGTKTRYYDSSIKFTPPSSPPWGNYPIIIKKVTLCTTKKAYTPYNNLNIYLSVNSEAFPGGFTAKPNKSIGVFNSSSTVITDSEGLAQIHTYLISKKTFYLHINKQVAGGTFLGYGDKEKPYINIEWEYAASTGSLSSTSIYTTGSVDLTLNVKGSNYYHKIDCYVNDVNTNRGITTESLTNTQKTYNFSITPTADEIDTWFSTTSSSSSGYFLITTYRSDNSTVGEQHRINFTLFLQSSTCVNTGYITLNSTSFTNTSSLPNIYIVNKTKIQVNASYSKKSSALNISYINLDVNDGVDYNSFSTTNAKITYRGTNFSATLILRDSRGISYSRTTYLRPVYSYDYQNIVLSGIDFFRSSGTSASILGTKIGCSFSASTMSLNGNNVIKEIYVKYNNNTSSYLKPNKTTATYSSMNLFDNVGFDRTSSYTLTIYIKDSVTGDPEMEGYSNGGYFTQEVSIPKAEYIIHIPKGGQGIAFGTAYTNSKESVIECGWPLHLPADKPLEVEYGGTGVKSYKSLLENILPEIDRTNSPTLNLSGNLHILSDMSTGMIQDGNLIVGNDLHIGSNKITFANGNAVLGYENWDDTIETANFFVECYDNSQEMLFSHNLLLYDPKYSDGGGWYSGTDYDVKLKSAFVPYAQVAGSSDASYGDYLENGILFATCGQMAQLTGQISPAKKIASGSTAEICTIPSHLPNSTIIRVCQGSTGHIWTLRINSLTGKVTFERYRNGGSNADCNAGTWLTFHVTWIVI